jgi:hypothetical protein
MGWRIPGWTDGQLRFAWATAREKRSELRLEFQEPGGATSLLAMYPAELSWFEVVTDPAGELSSGQ